MSFDKDLPYPLIISANILYTTPEDEQTQSEQLSPTAAGSSSTDWYLVLCWTQESRQGFVSNLELNYVYSQEVSNFW